MKPGDIIEFKGRGIVFQVLSRLLKHFNPSWSRWGWHLAIAVEYHKTKGWLIAEAIAKGVTLSWLDNKTLAFRHYTWIDREVHATEIRRFIADRAGCKYDVLAYVWTAIQFFFPRFPRIIDRSYTCWELVAEFCREMGKPIQQLHRYPFITDFLEAYERKPKPAPRGLDPPFYDSIEPYQEG